ncbi:YMGG-like glycine zipper-containing protein [Daejeonella oryzae]|uniref:YMGG-like glycine zipper-containing protein n=1 Tax=Daejeonella oryzae TaxID=1122943 RepID=UPI000427EA25|nr:YMGG-like glycine zipper-containing protein [Daejeonella oryzae]
MKKLLIIIGLAVGIAACNSDAKTNSQAYQNTKDYKDSLKLDSFQRAQAIEKEIDKREVEKAALVSASANNKVVSQSSTPKTRVVRQTTYVQSEPQKKGWSSAAKGAVIGAGAGAVTGILVDKKNGRGAVIGGVVGAGTGYVIGRSKDRKSGRVQ